MLEGASVFLSAETFSAPFTVLVENTCVFPAENVYVSGTQHVTFDPDTGRSFFEFHGTAFAPLTGVKYTVDETIHSWAPDGPGDSFVYFYDYRRATRQGETTNPITGTSDDFFLKIFMELPPGGRPPEMTFAGCR